MLKGAVTLVTGGASGLGRATVERLIKEGCRVIINDLRTSKGAEIVAEYGPEKAIFVAGNVASEEDVENVLHVTQEKFGRLDHVVNCAGIGISRQTYNFNKNRSHDVKDFAKVLEINVLGTFNVIRLAVGLMAKNQPPSEDGERGCIVNTASIAAYDGQKGQVAYAASKGALVSMTLPLARDLAIKGIRVVTVAPGLFRTPLLENLPKKVVDYLEDTVPFPSRLGEPSEFAEMVYSILMNPMLNGETIRLDGSLRMQP